MSAPVVLEAVAVTVRFGGLVAVDAVDARFHERELVGIIGPNGAGKTTFFNALSGVQPVGGGRIAVDGRDLTGAAPHRFAQAGVARTFQTPRVFGGLSVAANVDFGLQFAGRARGRAHRTGGRQATSVPQASDSEAGAAILGRLGLAAQQALPASALTPAQQRLLEIGMALATRPRVLLLDEVAAGLTEAEVESLARLIRSLRDDLGIAVVWIEHAVGTLLRFVERVLVLHQGRLLADGSPAAVVADPGVVEAYLGDERVDA